MQLLDVKFDNGQGDAEVDLSQGVIKITISEANPSFPSGLTVNIPLDPLFAKLESQAPNFLVQWGEKAAQALVDSAT